MIFRRCRGLGDRLSPHRQSHTTVPEMQRASRGEPRLLSAHDRQIYVVDHVTDRGLYPVLRIRPGRPPPHLPALHLSVRGIPVRRPTLLPPASFRRALLQHPCLRLPFASVRLGLDFDRFMCQITGHHRLAAGPCPAHNKAIKSDAKKRRALLRRSCRLRRHERARDAGPLSHEQHCKR